MPKRKNRRGAHFTPAHQRMAQACRTHESLSEAGRRGYRVTVERHGPDLAFEASRQYRIDHPSYPELVMMGVLKQLRVPYEREWRIDEKRLLCADFLLTNTEQVIEVHSDLHLHPKQQERDERKQALLKERGIPCLVVWDHQLEDERQSPAVIERIKDFVALGRGRQKTKSKSIEIESPETGLDLSI